ncbi:OprD family outer membrane porin [Campylobacter geochelonis]|uniref:Metalloid reductase RarA n=1 Tax=Campylobacter geochelonis TaxID=1780362 RepID=A0A128EE57_9BACT|nr:OprD family outer membrane porin [Campylobacter geochelonis]QKF72218.1 outer membrane porin, OprD family [Campylobacter geochelonis]CZE46493.1 metalloid reductase RarA [Campylobacter geochelonis]
MKLSKISLAVAATLCACSLNAADSLAQALQNGKIKGELKAWYWDRTFSDDVKHNENVFNLGVLLGYESNPFYNLRFGLTLQANTTPGIEDNAKKMFNTEQYATGAVLSEAYLGYTFYQTDIKIGRQFINTPVVAGNPARIFTESFEGVSITSNDVENTTIYANYLYKFQGRTSNVNTDKNGRAPYFKDKVILAGTGAYGHDFDGVYSVGVKNSSIPNLTLQAQYALVSDVNWRNTDKNGDVNLYFAEANYELPLDALKLKFDAQYRASRTSGGLDSLKYEGDLLGLRAGVAELGGLSASVAYTTTSDSDSLIVGVGNAPATYTGLPIRGPYVYSNHAGVDAFKYEVGYDFNEVGLKGLQTLAAYVHADQDSQANNFKAKGWSASMIYSAPYWKGFTTQVIYTELEKEFDNSAKDNEQKELWLKFGYKFTI